MARKTAAQMAANWVKGMQSPAASQNYKDAMQALTVNPMELAAQNLDKAAANFAQAVSSGRMAAKLRGVSMSAYKAACVVGAGRLASGATKGAPKQAAAAQRLQSVYDGMKQASMASGGTPGQKAAAAVDFLVAAKMNGQT